MRIALLTAWNMISVNISAWSKVNILVAKLANAKMDVKILLNKRVPIVSVVSSMNLFCLLYYCFPFLDCILL